MTHSKVPKITDLSEEERKSAEKWISMLPSMFRQCESRLRRYGAGEENVYKLINEMDTTRLLIDEARKDLIERHKIPDYPKGT